MKDVKSSNSFKNQIIRNQESELEKMFASRFECGNPLIQRRFQNSSFQSSSVYN